MVRDDTELKSLRRETADFISSDPTSVVLTRTETIDDGAGGSFEGDPFDMNPQIVKIQPMTSLRTPERISPAGQIMRPTHMVVGMQDLDMRGGDEFQWNGDLWSVAYVDHSQDYITKAEVIQGGH